MFKMHALATSVAAAAFLVACANQPNVSKEAVGDEPLMDQVKNTPSTTTRSAVEAQAAPNPPADGQASEKRPADPAASTRTHAQVEDEVIQYEKKTGELPDASGQAPLEQK